MYREALFIGFILILLSVIALIVNNKYGDIGATSKTRFLVERTKDKAANPLYSTIEFSDDKIVIDNTSFIMFSKIKRAYVSQSEQDIRLVGSLVYGGRRYKRGILYNLGIMFENKDGRDDSLRFFSLSHSEYVRYKKIADKINAKIGYVELRDEPILKEL